MSHVDTGVVLLRSQRTLPLHMTRRLKPSSWGGWGERSDALSSIISRLKRTPWMPCASK